MTTILVPVRYPPAEHSFRTIERGIEHIAEDEDGYLIILHVHLIQHTKKVSRNELRDTVYRKFGELPAHFIVRSGYVLEEAIIDEAARQRVDRVVIGSKNRTVRRKIASLLGLWTDLETVLEHELDIEIETVE